MERIIVIGCPGSGKTTFSGQIAEKTGLPLVHLDALHWRDGWQTVPKEEFDELLLAELTKPRWIIDGNYNRTIPLRLQYCDTVIWLDYPRTTCMLGVIKRVITNYGKSRPDMGGNCPERLDFEFLRTVWGFRKKHHARYFEMLANARGVTVFVMKNRKATEKFLESL